MSDDSYDELFVDDNDEPDVDAQEVDDSDDAEGLIRRAISVVEGARTMPLSASVLVSRDELMELLQAALDRIPDEMRQARWLLRERDEFMESQKREADRLLEDVRAQAERMVQRTEIVRQANLVAERTVEEAREDARRLRHEADDFCDQKLASFEIVLERILKTVLAGREKLRATPPPTTDAGGWRAGQGQGLRPQEREDQFEGDGGFFDQDE